LLCSISKYPPLRRQEPLTENTARVIMATMMVDAAAAFASSAAGAASTNEAAGVVGEDELNDMIDSLWNYDWWTSYAPQIVVLAMLSAITVYRREMSCNRCYYSDDDDDDDDSSKNSGAPGDNKEHQNDNKKKSNSLVMSEMDWNEDEAEETLERMGLYCSGAPLMPALWLSLVEKAHHYDDGDDSIWRYVLERLVLSNNDGGLGTFSNNKTAVEGRQRSENDDWSRRRPVSDAAARSSATETTAASASTSTTAAANDTTSSSTADARDLFFANSVPDDVQIHVLSYLHAKDVLHYGCVNRACHDVVNNNNSSDSNSSSNNKKNATNTNGSSSLSSAISSALWKTLWERDYGWIICSWDVGRQALDRSLLMSSHPGLASTGDTDTSAIDDPLGTLPIAFYSKEFYFKFGLSFLNYTLAGQATNDRCLVGIRGHVYDLTSFLSSHPGSPETVLVQAGRDATQFFAGVGHSAGARKLGQTMCVVVDASRLSEEQRRQQVQPAESDGNESCGTLPPCCGLRPTAQTRKFGLGDGDGNDDKASTSHQPLPAALAPPQIPSERRPTGYNSIGHAPRRIRDAFLREERRAKERVLELAAKN